MKRQKLNSIALHLFWALIATTVGVVLILLGDHLLGVQLEVFQGMSTFSIPWILDLILVPLVAGFFVSLIYGLGGKMIAHLPALLAKSYVFYNLTPDMIPEGAAIVPLGFWILLVIVVVEACAAGGLIGEFVIKRTYGRRPRHLIHKRYRQESVEN
ncbi:MAG: hypothetical protein OEM38_00745 [Gammaproteobacteria bacterium]|nr:hypothetical protein [Gammaproteobacteria bacterium]